MDRFETFAVSILELNRYLQKIKDMEMRTYGLRGNHVMCLYYLGKNNNGLTATELTEVCREDKAAISRSLAQLIELGYIYRNQDEQKRSYRSKLFLTEKGKELVTAIDQKIDSILTQGSHGLTPEQRNIFYSTMNIIIQNLSEYVDSGKE